MFWAENRQIDVKFDEDFENQAWFERKVECDLKFSNLWRHRRDLIAAAIESWCKRSFLQADLWNEISKEKKEYKWKNPAELERKRPHFLKSVSNERGIQGFKKILEEWAAPSNLSMK